MGAIGHALALAGSATVMAEGITWNYTTWLNIAFLILAAVLVAQFVRTGGRHAALMGGSPDDAAEQVTGRRGVRK